MPSDWLIYWLTTPSSVAIIAAAVCVPFAIWRIVLASAFPAVGFAPLAAGYLAAATGLLASNFVVSTIEFDARVARTILTEAQRLTTVTGWTLYLSLLSLVLVLPLLGLGAVPWTAWLLKVRRFTPRAIAATLIGGWLVLVLAEWASPGNDWHRSHPVESLWMSMTSLAIPVVLIGQPFLCAVFALSRRYRIGSEQHPSSLG